MNSSSVRQVREEGKRAEANGERVGGRGGRLLVVLGTLLVLVWRSQAIQK